ncbi:MAG: chemotaxis-specific protein-glutamate methyltransferase CheB [Lachnospiraceae bacterium]|jgi:two-component system chemotaxis response regulator CheB|nr:chemotaxis-specific protein-glutamate methyltransferase CheB [Lachnospiraceae bacterium]
MKKILVVDDSALMRRVICDIIDTDSEFQVADRATNGLEALDLLSRNTYDAVVLDVNMPKMNGIELLRELRKRKISARVMMASTDTMDGAQVTMEALDLGAIDFIHKPQMATQLREGSFTEDFLRTLKAVAVSKAPEYANAKPVDTATVRKVTELVTKHASFSDKKRIVAIASSTGGPKALQTVMAGIPKQLSCPVVLVQHMPTGFTKSLADRLNELSGLEVKEAQEGDKLEAGHLYLSQGGKHMNVVAKPNGEHYIHYTDEPTREGVKPCANYMYESLRTCRYEEVLCVVLTGMGADGTQGIRNLKEAKKIHVIAQEQSTCAVYGMPRSVVAAGLADQIIPLDQIAQEIILNVGVR